MSLNLALRCLCPHHRFCAYSAICGKRLQGGYGHDQVMNSENTKQAALSVDANTITERAVLGRGAELASRERPAGHVHLPDGQQEFLVYASFGQPIDRTTPNSMVCANGMEQSWRSCPTGEVTFIPAGVPFEWSWNYRSRSTHLAISAPLMAELSEQDLSEMDCAVFRQPDRHLAGLLSTLQDESQAAIPGSDLMTSSLLTAIAIRLQRLTSSEFAHAHEAQECEVNEMGGLDFSACHDYLSDRLAEAVPLSELAANFGMTIHSFTRWFKREAGIPPHQYQLRLRIQRASELLCRSPKLTVAEIATSLGFSDESHLRRHFRRIIGTSPGRYRKRR